MSALSIRNVRKTYGHQEVLKGIDLEVQSGEFTILVGASGCGKSTLLNIIAGLDMATSGQVEIGGRPMNGVVAKDRDIAMVFQSYALYPSMTVRQNITFGMECRRVPKAAQAEAVARVAKLLQIETLLNRRPSQLSGGQRQRVAMGRALVRDPLLFLFDEPLSNLDAKLRVEMRMEIKRLHQRLGSTIVYVTHDQIEAMTLATRIAVMHQGEVQQSPIPIPSTPSGKPVRRPFHGFAADEHHAGGAVPRRRWHRRTARRRWRRANPAEAANMPGRRGGLHRPAAHSWHPSGHASPRRTNVTPRDLC